MFKDEFQAAANGAVAKKKFLSNNPVGYFALSMMAGMFIGFGNLLVFSISGQLQGAPYTKLIMGCCFGIALSLVVIAGAELFTGNNLVMTAGVLKKTVTIGDALKLWVICWIGNWAGAWVLAGLFHFSGLYSEATLAAMSAGAAAKMSAGPMALLCRGILCNTLVCLAVWSGFRTKNDAAKLIMIWWCLLAFITTGFEHSIANMTLLSLALIQNTGDPAITVGHYFYNLGVVTVGNLIGAIVFVALPYYLGSKDKAEA